MNHIFYHKIKSDIDKKILDTSILSSEEKMRAQSFRFDKDFNLYVSGKLLAKKSIASFFNLKPEDIKFKKDNYDRPFLDHSEVKDFDFNLSHSGEYVVLAISDKRIGIDIEEIKPIDLNLSEDCFHEKERQFLLQSGKDQLAVFYNIWTLKESFIKAIGEGLSYPLKNFYFDMNDPQFNINILDHKYNESWNFKTYNIDDNYKMAACIKNSELINEPKCIIDLI